LKSKYFSISLLIVIVFVAAALRLWRLTEFPPGILGDEAVNGNEIIRLLSDPHVTVFFPANSGREALFFYIASLPFIILGPTLFALRLVPALAGILLVPLSYRWARILEIVSNYVVELLILLKWDTDGTDRTDF
jgi:predicted membrane-bound mannosyltransferase